MIANLKPIPVLAVLLALGVGPAARAGDDAARAKTLVNLSSSPWSVTLVCFLKGWEAKAALGGKAPGGFDPAPMPQAGPDALTSPWVPEGAASTFIIPRGEAVTLLLEPPPGKPQGSGLFLLCGGHGAQWRKIAIAFAYHAEDPSSDSNRLIFLKVLEGPGAGPDLLHCEDDAITLMDPAKPSEGSSVAVESKEERKQPAPGPTARPGSGSGVPSGPYGSFLDAKPVRASGTVSPLASHARLERTFAELKRSISILEALAGKVETDPPGGPALLKSAER